MLPYRYKDWLSCVFTAFDKGKEREGRREERGMGGEMEGEREGERRVGWIKKWGDGRR